jgi:hypothetical protein
MKILFAIILLFSGSIAFADGACQKEIKTAIESAYLAGGADVQDNNNRSLDRINQLAVNSERALAGQSGIEPSTSEKTIIGAREAKKMNAKLVSDLRGLYNCINNIKLE